MGSEHPRPMSRVFNLKPHLAPLALITLAAAIFFAPDLFGGYWLPNGGGDLAVFLWPTYSFASHSLHAGQLPLWNPHLYSGAPFWADNQSSVLYPPTLLVMLLTDVPYQALEALVIFHVWLAGIAMYVCAAGLSSEYRVPSTQYETHSRPGTGNRVPGTLFPALSTQYSALLAAVLWMFSDGFVTHIGNLNLIAAAAWLPLVVLGAWCALRDLSWRWAVFAAVVWGLVVLAGHAQIAYFTGLMIGGVGVWWVGIRLINLTSPPGGEGEPAKRAGIRPILATVGLLILVLALGLGISAGSWLPALEMTAQTGRAGLAYEEAAKFSLPPQALIGMVAPWVYGRGPAAFSGGWDRVEVGYIGAVGLVMSLLGIAVAIRRRSRLGIFLAVVALLSFGVALGNFAPLHRLAYDLVPGFKNFRAPARYILLMNFAQALLAGIALGEVGRWVGGAAVRPSPPNPLSPEGARGSQVSSRIAPLISIALILVATAELVGFGAGVEIDQADPRANFSHPDAIAWLAAQSRPDQPFRIDAAPAGHWQQDLAALHGGPLYDIYGVSNPLALASYEGWYWAVGSRGTPTYNFLGARYVIAEGGSPADATFKPVAQFADGLSIYENTRALPLALIVPNAVAVDSTGKASDLAHAPDWDPRSVVYVEGGPAIGGKIPPGGSLAYTEYSGNRLAVTVQTVAPAYVVFSEVYFPGWVATLDGRPATIYRANAAFRAVYVDAPGPHTIVMEFKPPLVTLGLAISAVSVLAVIGLSTWARKSHRRAAESAEKDKTG